MAKRKPSKPAARKLPGNKRAVKPVIISSLMDGTTVSGACAGAKISRETFYAWYREDPDFAKKVDEAKESRVQHVEDALYKNAIGGGLTAEIFFLCNRAPGRWKNVQKVEAELNAPVPIQFVSYDPAKHGNPGKGS